MMKTMYLIGICGLITWVRCDTMSYVNLTPCERRTLIEGILSSDVQYLEKLVKRKFALMLELELLEGSILKKAAEVQAMQANLNFVDEYH